MTDTRASLIAALEWQFAMGIDCALSDAPVDRVDESRELADRRKTARASTRQSASPAGRAAASRTAIASTPSIGNTPPPSDAPLLTGSEPASPPPLTRPGSVSIPDDQSVMAARDAASTALTIEELRSALEAFNGCNLKITATHLVFADGNPDGRIMFVGEAPGREEDIQGKPFVGRSGQLLDRMLTAIGLTRDDVYIANVVPWRPPGNRTPTPQETEICRPFIHRQIELANPDILVPLGGAAAKQLLRAKEGILRLRGKWMSYQTSDRHIDAVATLHPAYLLRQPLQKRYAWRDFLAIRKKLDESGKI